MKTALNPHSPTRSRLVKTQAWALALATLALASRGADIQWQGNAASYSTALDWVGGVVPGAPDRAINDNGTNNAVQINLGDLDWTVNQILAGASAGSGAFTQNGQNLNLTGVNSNQLAATVYPTSVRLGLTAGHAGLYTLNGGTNNYGSSAFNVGELGTAVLNINGGLIDGTGNFAVNNGLAGTPLSVNATIGNGVTEGDFTWFEQGYYAPNTSVGFPHPGSTITSLSQGDHAFTLPGSYAVNNAAVVSANVTNVTITPSGLGASTALSFLCTAGNGQTVVNYKVHHADATTETGSLTIPDWFGPGTANEVLAVGSRVDALGFNFQFPSSANGFSGNAPYMWSLDISLTDTTSAVTSIDFAYVSGGVASVMGLSSSTGSGFSPVAISGFNQDVVVEQGAQDIVSPAVTDVVNQTAGAVNLTGNGQLFIGNFGTGVYNLSGGSVDVHNYIAIGRSGGNGTLNMTGGAFNQDGGGNLLVGSGYQVPYGGSAVGVLNQSGGAINCQSQFLCPESSPSTGTYNLSGTGSLTVDDWLVIGRQGAFGTVNMSGGTILKQNNGNFEVGEGTVGTLNQTGGSVTTYNELWIGQAGGSVGTYNLSGSSSSLTAHNWLVVGRSGGNGTLNLTNATVNKVDNGDFIVGDGGGGVGVVNMVGGTFNVANGWFRVGNGGTSASFTQDGGTVSVGNGQFLIPDNTDTATYTMLDNAILTVNSWLAIGRGNGAGTLTLNSGSITRTDGGSHFDVGAGGTGVFNQNGGTIINLASDFWLGESATGTWNLNGGSATLANLVICVNGNASGTLNLNGGTLQAAAVQSANSIAISTVNFNGGTLQASIDNPAFISGIVQLMVSAGGAIIDSQSHTITISEALQDSGGGLTKNGAGTLNLPGANTYSGATLVNAGVLNLGTSSSGGGAATVADGATLGTLVQSANAQLNVSSLNVGTTSGATLDFDLGSFGNPTSAPLNASGVMTGHGTITINVAAAVAAVGTVPLVQFASLAGSPTLALGTLPPGVVAHLATTANNINLVITSAGAPRWDGTVNNVWDTTTANWFDLGTLMATTYTDGKPAVFDDAASGSTTVNLAITAQPGSVSFNNSSLPYTIIGTGKISGTTGLTLNGSGTVAIMNTGGNNFTGPVTLNAGSLTVTNLANGGIPSAIGAASSAPTNIVFNGGNLTYSGAPTSVNRGYTVQGGSGSITTTSNLTLSGAVTATLAGGFNKSGLAKLAYVTTGTNTLSGTGSSGYIVSDGSVVFDGSAGGQTNVIGGSRLGVDGQNSTAMALVTNATMNLGGNIDVGDVAGTAGLLTVDGNSTVNVGSWLIFGDGGNVTSALNLNNGTLNVNSGNLLMGGRPGDTSTLNINGGVLNKSGGTFDIADGGWNGSGARTGTVNQNGGVVNSSDQMWLGQVAGGSGIYNLNGGTLNVHNWLAVGRAGSVGVINMTGGVLNQDGGGNMDLGTGAGDNSAVSIGTFNQSGGTFNCGNEYWIAENSAAIGTNNISGTAVVNVSSYITVGRQGLGVVNFSNGTFNQTGGNPLIVGIYGGSTGIWNQTGGQLTTAADIWIAQGDLNAHGTINLSGGTITNHGWLAVGREGGTGVFNINGGIYVKAGSGNTSIAHGGGTGTVNVNNGLIDLSAGETWIGEDSNVGTWNMNGGTARLAMVRLAENASAGGVLNLNGGSVTANEITTGNTGSTNRTLNFNGGTLVAGTDNANYIHDLTVANVQTGGAVINTAGHAVWVNQALLGAGADGGLTKNGNGTLCLNGVNTYTNLTQVTAGALGGSGTIAGAVSVASGATLAPGTTAIGTLTINGNLTLAAGSSTLAKINLYGGATNNDQVVTLGNVAYNGSLVVTNVGTILPKGGQFKLFNAASHTGNFSSVTILPAGSGSFNPTTGILTVAPQAPIVFNRTSVSGGNLVLTGNGGKAGGSYSVLTTTNLNPPIVWTTNTAGQFDGTGAFSNAIPMLPGDHSRFFNVQTP